jgi:hypothetical protein
MTEVPVAFPNDETTAELIASRLRAAGIAARVDRGLYGSWQVPARGQLTVFVNRRNAKRAHDVLGTKPREESTSPLFLRLGIVLVAGALLVGMVAIVTQIAGR